MYAVGHNTPGYLPESDPWTVESFSDGVALLVESIERYTEDADLTLAEANAVFVALDDLSDAHRVTPGPLGYILEVEGRSVSFWLDIVEEAYSVPSIGVRVPSY